MIVGSQERHDNNMVVSVASNNKMQSVILWFSLPIKLTAMIKQM